MLNRRTAIRTAAVLTGSSWGKAGPGALHFSLGRATFIHAATAELWLYLASVIDCSSRAIRSAGAISETATLPEHGPSHPRDAGPSTLSSHGAHSPADAPSARHRRRKSWRRGADPSPRSHGVSGAGHLPGGTPTLSLRSIACASTRPPGPPLSCNDQRPYAGLFPHGCEMTTATVFADVLPTLKLM